ncbi:hypothetical protein J6590_058011 [Homalodisca vitripennis]|nr:hypothetical protein J6590_058011 [Homalodisca vitripennis]
MEKLKLPSPDKGRMPAYACFTSTSSIITVAPCLARREGSERETQTSPPTFPLPCRLGKTYVQSTLFFAGSKLLISQAYA